MATRKNKKNVVTVSTEKTADNFRIEFKQGKTGVFDMFSFLEDTCESQVWQQLPLKKMVTSIESGGALLLEDIKSRYRFMEGTTDDAIVSTIENGQGGDNPGAQMLIQTDISGRRTAFLLSDVALGALIQRAGVDCSVMGKVTKTEQKTIIDIGLVHSAEKEVQALFSFGKIRALNGGSTYSVLPQDKLFGAVTKMLKDRFKTFEFCGGYYTHTRTWADFELSDNQPILESYNEACKEAGRTQALGLKTHFTFSTSEVGDECATLTVSLVRGALRIVLGSPIKVSHQGDNSIEKFETELEMVLSKTRDLVGNLKALINKKIEYPVNCMVSIGKYVGLPKTCVMAAAAILQEIADGNKEADIDTTAHDVFFSLQEAMMAMREKYSLASVENAEENLARTLTEGFKWEDFDTVVRTDWQA